MIVCVRKRKHYEKKCVFLHIFMRVLVTIFREYNLIQRKIERKNLKIYFSCFDSKNKTVLDRRLRFCLKKEIKYTREKEKRKRKKNIFFI